MNTSRTHRSEKSVVYDGRMRILDWLAQNLTGTMLKRWMLIGFALIVIGLLSLSF